MARINKQIILNEFVVGRPKPNNFKLVEVSVPELQPGEILIKALYFNLDGYMERLMRERKAYPYSNISNVKIGEVIHGSSVGIVEQSNNPDFKEGDMVVAYTGWQEYAILKGNLITALPWAYEDVKKVSGVVKPSYYLGSVGMTGLTAYAGISEVGHAKAGETVVTSASIGAVSSIFGQMAKLKGCRVVGMAGTDDKCKFITEELGFDECVNYKNASFIEDLQAATPQKIDIYFDTVGGPIFNTVLPLLNERARALLCGSMGWLNYTEPEMPMAPDITALMHFSRMPRRFTIQAFLVFDYMDKYDEFLKETIPLIQSGQLKVLEDVTKGIENAPEGFIKMLQGKHFGKPVVEL
ncbi:MAG: NADP-dependent oxidoreductase [Alphaproteobacteria bacterium]|nr:NADP-dependent oxidoreductase [Alphaproteobacteria bacterium]